MAKRPYPLFHPRSPRRAPKTLTIEEFQRNFASENDFVEFKQGVGRNAIHRAVTAFSNSDGGVMLLGVADDGSITGRTLTSSVEDQITQAIRAIHNPGRYWVHSAGVDGRAITVLAVARRSQGFAQTSDGLVLVRRGAHNVPLLGADLLQFVTTRSLSRFDRTDSGIALTEADPELLEDLRKIFRWRRIDEDRLRSEHLITENGTPPSLTVAGALSLLREPATRLGKAYVEVLRFPDEGVNYDLRREFGGPVQEQVARATEFVMEQLGTELIVSGLRRLELPKLPEVVVREAMANAAAHRNYEELGRAIRVELRPGHVVVESPGGLPEPVTEENIREMQSARNIDVIRILRRFALAEDSGRGVDVMQDEMAAALLDAPEFHDLEHSVRVTLPVAGAISPQERAWIIEVERRGEIDPRDRIVLVHAARGEQLTNERVRELLGVDSRDARNVLKRLTRTGLLERFGERGGSYYVLSPAVGAPAAFRLSPPALRELVVSLAQSAPLTNAVVRQATGLDRTEALRLLEGLVREGRLVRRGERRGTRYESP